MKLFLLALVVLVGCGRAEFVPSPTPPGPGPAPTPVTEKVTIAVFGASWCPGCKSELPEVERQLQSQLTAEERARIDFRLYVQENTSQAQADAYAKLLHLSATAYVDARGQTFRKLVTGQPIIPAGAVIDTAGKVRSFRAGPTSFVPAEIVAFAKQAAQK